jgi:tetratricopeptide (TPR) repeat protein
VLSLHYFEAGQYQPALRYATAAAKRAESAYADVEAAGLYARALEAGRQLKDLEPRELATVEQAMGDAWYRAGEFQKASEAYTAARPLAASDRLMDAGLVLKRSHVEEKLGNYAEALRWASQARESLKELTGPEAAREAARSGAWCAMLLQAEARTSEAIEWAQQTLKEAEAADDLEARADAYFVIGWAYGDLGREGRAPSEGLTAQSAMQRSLEAYQQAGNRVREAQMLGMLGGLAFWENRWDDAFSFYERGRDAALKIGSTVDAAVARVNIAEILTERGEWTEAEALLLQALPVCKASQYHYFLAHCLLLLGRASLCTGRLDGALTRLQDAKANFVRVGAEKEVPAVEARIAECHIAKGNPEAAIELASGLLSNASQTNGVASVVPLLERVRGHGLLRQGDLWGARDALDASLAAAREQNQPLEASLTILSLIELDRLEGVEPPLEMVNESRSQLASLKVRAVSPVPLPPV